MVAMANYITKMKQKLFNPIFWADRDIAEAAKQTQSVHEIQRVVTQSVEKRFKQAFGSLATPAFRADLHEVALGNKSLNDLAAQHNFVQGQRFAFLQKILKEKADLDAKVRKLGGMPPRNGGGMSDEEAADYLTRMYYRFMLEPGMWAKLKLKDDVAIKRAVEFFKKSIKDEAVKGHAGMTPQELDAEKGFMALRDVHEVLGSEDYTRLQDWRKGKGPSGADRFMASMKNRTLEAQLLDLRRQANKYAKTNQTIPPELAKQIAHEEERVLILHDLLGESTDGITAIATSLGRQKAVVVRLEAMNGLANVPELVSLSAGMKAADGRAFVEIPSTESARRTYGNLAGRFVHPDVAESIHWMENAPQIAADWKSHLWAMVKANLLLPVWGGMGAMTHNVVGDLMNAVLSGGLDITTPDARAGVVLQKAFSATLAANQFRKLGTPGAELYERGVKWGMVAPGYAEGEVVNRNAKVLRQLGKDPTATVWDYAKVLAQNPLRTLKVGVLNPLAKAYDAPSRLWKFAAWVGNRERILANPGRYLGSRFTPGMDQALLEHHAEALAAKWTAEAFPNFDRMARWQENLRASSIGGGALFPSFATEALRIYGTFPARLARSGKAVVTGNVEDGADPELALRAMRLGLIGVELARLYQAQRRANGITDEDIQEAFHALPDYVQAHGAGVIADWSRDADGKIVFRDYSGSFDPLRFVGGREDAGWAGKLVWNVAKTPISGGLLDGPLVNMFGEPLGLEDAFRQGEAKPWQKAGAGYIDALLKVPVFPQGVTRIKTPLGQAGIGGEPTLRGRQLNTAQAVSSIMGLPTHPVGDREIGNTAYFNKQELQKAKGNVKSAYKPQAVGPATSLMEALGGGTPAEQRSKAALDAQQEVIRRRFGGKTP